MKLICLHVTTQKSILQNLKKEERKKENKTGLDRFSLPLTQKATWLNYIRCRVQQLHLLRQLVPESGSDKAKQSYRIEFVSLHLFTISLHLVNREIFQISPATVNKAINKAKGKIKNYNRNWWGVGGGVHFYCFFYPSPSTSVYNI